MFVYQSQRVTQAHTGPQVAGVVVVPRKGVGRCCVVIWQHRQTIQWGVLRLLHTGKTIIRKGCAGGGGGSWLLLYLLGEQYNCKNLYQRVNDTVKQKDVRSISRTTVARSNTAPASMPSAKEASTLGSA